MPNGETIIRLSIFQRCVEAVSPDNPGGLVDFEREMTASHHRITILLVIHWWSSEQLNVERRASLTCFLHIFTKNVTNTGIFQVGIEHRQHAEHTFLAHRGKYSRVQGRYVRGIHLRDVNGFGSGHITIVGERALSYKKKGRPIIG